MMVIGVDSKHWWSNGLVMRAELDPGKRFQFVTSKGIRDGSDVNFPGSYAFDGGRQQHELISLLISPPTS